MSGWVVATGDLAASVSRDERSKRSVGSNGTMKSSSRSTLIVITIGLAFLDIWGDMKGSGSALAPLNEIVQSSLINGRMVGLLGILLCCILAVLRPTFFVKRNGLLRIVVPAFAAFLSFAFLVIPVADAQAGVLGVVAVLAAGLCYGWLEIKMLGAVAVRRDSIFSLVLVLAASLGLKAIAIPLVGALPDAVQSVVFVAMPLALGCLLFLMDEGAFRSPLPPARAGKLDPSSSIVVILILFSVLSATARGISGFGFWGGGSVVSLEGIGPAAIAVPPFVLLAYAGFLRCEERKFVSVAIKLLLVLLVGFLVTGSGFLAWEFVSGYLGEALDLFMDVYATFLLRVAIVVTVRTASVHPYTAVGLGDAVMCALSIVFGLGLAYFPEIGPLIVLLAMFGTAVFALLMLEGTIERESVVGAAEPSVETVCAELSSRYDLTPREAEVLALLAQGRSQTFISDELTLAPSTVKTHMKRIYQKLGVRSKQELISLTRQP